MYMHDQHVHSKYSMDSNEELEKYYQILFGIKKRKKRKIFLSFSLFISYYYFLYYFSYFQV